MATQTRTEVMDNVALVGEQLRKSTEAAVEQTRQTMKVAQEQIQQNLTEVQQAQSDAAKMLIRLNEQNSQLATAAISSLWDASLSGLKLTVWGQEQAERTLLRTLEQGRTAREEGATLFRDIAEEVQHNQTQLFRLMQESLRVGFFYAGKTQRRESEAAR